jgi:hypothetical protein
MFVNGTRTNCHLGTCTFSGSCTCKFVMKMHSSRAIPVGFGIHVHPDGFLQSHLGLHCVFNHKTQWCRRNFKYGLLCRDSGLSSHITKVSKWPVYIPAPISMTQKGSFAVTNGHFIPLPLVQGAETTINQHQSQEPKPRRTKLRKLKYVNVKHVNMKLKT